MMYPVSVYLQQSHQSAFKYLFVKSMLVKCMYVPCKTFHHIADQGRLNIGLRGKAIIIITVIVIIIIIIIVLKIEHTS